MQIFFQIEQINFFFGQIIKMELVMVEKSDLRDTFQFYKFVVIVSHLNFSLYYAVLHLMIKNNKLKQFLSALPWTEMR